MLRFFPFFHFTLVRIHYVLSPLLTVPSERPPPKHSFPFMCCAWFHYPVLTCFLWTSFFPHALPQCSLIPAYRTAKLSLYICLYLSATNTAWSVRHVPTYLNDDMPCISLNFNLLDSPWSLDLSKSPHYS